ncbi:hypothetical protein COY90_00380 [Candidatus Roizmanbacteria bacterium CG_4_10_14_0_8_um_filter_39_9]|uniref:Glycosidase n=1 Tax=Candidatus Roizmanbacteria bacterium CG_4_10_14_0_8_um_filter_39_9 TaxID=1974829 RepID=A0A2M7QF60_9BACT|nr:MAG: hypothetical protein COY90_00380 [Candidatus Roizmanbacteria bacterium CG_4_10_14_0_8_um_filter_39_9]
MKINKIKNIFPGIEGARFNMGVWYKSKGDSLFFIGREVLKAGEVGEPDTGILKLFEMDKDGNLIHERLIWKPLYDGINLEDPRALRLPNENLIIGLTCVLRNKSGHPVPFPAIVKIDYLDSWKQNLPPFLVIDTFGPGKNITPIDMNTFLFRPDSFAYNHKILVFSLASQVAEKLGDIEFPKDLPWAAWRVGTTMPPIWLSANEALFIIHGITKQIIDGKEKYIYSIGRARLVRQGKKFRVTVAPEPILTPDNFLDKEGKSLVTELHPELRRVVYSCGGVVNKNMNNSLLLYVNVGDRATFEVELSLNEMKAGLFNR